MTEKEHQLSILIGEMLRVAREELELTQEEVAELAELSYGHFGRLERGERSMKLYTFLKLGDVLPFFEIRFTR